MQKFKDNFSLQAGIYAKYRPQYPAVLYQFLASLTKDHHIAWDCGTGNGQAAIGLVDFYESVIATDPSENQIKNCFPHERIKYIVEKAEDFSYGQHTIDIVTIANALHWFEFDVFYNIVRNVVKQDGIIAAWSYGRPTISKEIDEIVAVFHDDIVGEYWVKENRFVEQEYKTIPFPFHEINCPSFVSQKEFNLKEFITYLNTWSATQKFIIKTGIDPTIDLQKQLLAIWGSADTKKIITWKLIMKAGRLSI